MRLPVTCLGSYMRTLPLVPADPPFSMKRMWMEDEAKVKREPPTCVGGDEEDAAAGRHSHDVMGRVGVEGHLDHTRTHVPALHAVPAAHLHKRTNTGRQASASQARGMQERRRRLSHQYQGSTNTTRTI
jgi:hypothetical protein